MSADFAVSFISLDKTDKPRVVNVPRNATILDAARHAGIEIDATCGSRGRCRSCRVKILKGDTPPPTVQDSVQLGHDETREGFRLACQTRMLGDTTIMAVPPKAEEGHQILQSGNPGLDDHRTHLDCGVDKRVIHAKAPIE